MKQHITPKQFSEITFEQAEKILGDNLVARNDWVGYHHKKVTIGKLIEFMGSDFFKISYVRIYYVKVLAYEDEVFEKDFPALNLIDALWDATKYLLSEGE